MTVTLWVRPGERESDEAQLFLKAHGYRPDRLRDADREPPTPAEQAFLGNTWQKDGRVVAPILLTPRGAVVGFRERRWRAFLDMDHHRS